MDLKTFESVLCATESPIEHSLAGLIEMYCGMYGIKTSGPGDAPAELVIIPQWQYAGAGHRYDFAFNRPGYLLLAVECDGFAFHSSEDAFVADRRNDARLLAACVEPGEVAVMRFAGKDLYHNPEWCAKAVLRALGFRQVVD